MLSGVTFAHVLALMWGLHDRTCACRMRRVTVQLCVSCFGAASRACHMLTGVCGTQRWVSSTPELNHDSVLLPEPMDWHLPSCGCQRDSLQLSCLQHGAMPFWWGCRV